MLENLFDFYKNFVEMISSSPFYKDYISTLPSPLNNVTFDSLVIIAGVFVVLRWIVSGIFRGIRIKKLKKNLTKKEEPEKPKEQPVDETAALMRDWIKLQIASSMGTTPTQPGAKEEPDQDDTDQVTGLPGRLSFKRAFNKADDTNRYFALAVFRVADNSPVFNHTRDDVQLIAVATVIKGFFDELYRTGERELAAIVPIMKFRPETLGQIDEELERMQDERNDGNIYSVIHGYAFLTEALTASSMFPLVERRMNEDLHEKTKIAEEEEKFEPVFTEPEREAIPCIAGEPIEIPKEPEDEPIYVTADDLAGVDSTREIKEMDKKPEPKVVFYSPSEGREMGDKDEGNKLGLESMLKPSKTLPSMADEPVEEPSTEYVSEALEYAPDELEEVDLDQKSESVVEESKEAQTETPESQPDETWGMTFSEEDIDISDVDLDALYNSSKQNKP